MNGIFLPEPPLEPASQNEWNQFFGSLWPYYQADLAGLKQSFFKPIGKLGNEFYAYWLVSKDLESCPIVRLSNSKERTFIVASNRASFMPDVDQADAHCNGLNLIAFLDCFQTQA